MNISKIGLVAVAAAALMTGTANADIFAQVGPLGFGVVTNFEDFQSYGDFEVPGQPFDSPGGFNFDLASGSFVIWQGDGVLGFPTRSLYQNGGAMAMTQIRMTDGSDIPQIELDIGNGFGANPQNVWVRAYNNGSPTGDDFSFKGLDIAGTITVWSTGSSVFDELRVQSYGASAIEGSETQYGAVAIDNVTVGTVIPAPGVLALLAMAGLASRRRRR